MDRPAGFRRRGNAGVGARRPRCPGGQRGRAGRVVDRSRSHPLGPDAAPDHRRDERCGDHLLGARGPRRRGAGVDPARGRQCATVRPAAGELHSPIRSRRSTGRGGYLRATRGSAVGVSPGVRAERRRGIECGIDRHTRVARAARTDGPPPAVGPGHPALQRPLRTIVGHRRSDRPGRSGRVVGRRARRRVSADQSAACDRAHQADRAVSLPADLAALRQPAVPARRGDPRVRRPAQPGAGTKAACPVDRPGRQPRRDRPEHLLEGQGARAEEGLPGPSLGRPAVGVRRLSGPRGRCAGCVRHLVRAGRALR